MKIKNILPIVVLVAICLAAALLLSLVNMVTSPIIENARNQAANENLLVVLPDGKNFEKIELDERYPAIVQEGYRADGGFVFIMSVTGKSSGFVIMCGINTEGKIVGTKVMENQETPSYAEKVFSLVEGLDGSYSGMDASSFEPQLVAGATLTSRAYGEAINAALQAFVIANGGEVDIRQEIRAVQPPAGDAADFQVPRRNPLRHHGAAEKEAQVPAGQAGVHFLQDAGKETLPDAAVHIVHDGHEPGLHGAAGFVRPHAQQLRHRVLSGALFLFRPVGIFSYGLFHGDAPFR